MPLHVLLLLPGMRHSLHPLAWVGEEGAGGWGTLWTGSTYSSSSSSGGSSSSGSRCSSGWLAVHCKQHASRGMVETCIAYISYAMVGTCTGYTSPCILRHRQISPHACLSTIHLRRHKAQQARCAHTEFRLYD